ncbi:diguanylate cyclase (GGDEF)-like protein/PAS domain S-box-containing protein [Povalibacter uvarum]|uniref:Diguanylate cyclase (GGDEF)-like protein/PAS domain S-box-containing protein n=1 Tax=Povalibacter uvarum TaxID=732238 RepID=A0A841HKG4_9GAMM|nr:EAL domain-containing protein [Povalibacter uvarum]MBB6093537.1 diguanylate cyclase (GGDEF)-like protein/PAS domain S-box-containing protein [Povalibacter uvarum]
MNRLREHGWWLIAPVVLAAVLLLRASGYLEPLENAARDARSQVLQHEVDSDIVVVGIDPESLADLQQWPWPRRYHARLLERIADAQPKAVFIDIDFSAHSDPEDDALLEAALSRFDKRHIVLPTFIQRTADDDTLAITTPLERFSRHATLAGVNLAEPGADSLVRGVKTTWSMLDSEVPSAVAFMANVDLPPQSTIPIDFSLSPSSFEFISYVDLLAGRVPASALKDKTVLVGATAVELNDMVPVPVYRSLPGVVVQALAIQSVRSGVPISTPAWVELLVLALVATGSAAYFAAHRWRHNLIALAGGLLVAALAWTWLSAGTGLSIEFVPLALIAVVTFAVITLRSLDRETWRAMIYSLGLKRRDALLRSVVESSAEGILCIDRRGTIRTANAAAAQLFGRNPQDLIDQSLRRFIPSLPTQSSGELQPRRLLEIEAQRDGHPFAIEVSISPLDFPDEALFTAIVRDVTERQVQQRALQYQATHDPLTSLPNRTALSSYLSAALQRTRSDESVALLMLDLSRFKEVNDTLGHAVGDQVLSEVARRFESVSSSGFIARIGGDEFTLVFDRIGDIGEITRTALALNDCLRSPIHVNGIAIDVGVSIGIALFPQHADTSDALLKNADVAMYACKRHGSAFELYDPTLDQHSVRRLTMVSELRQAIETGQLSLHYQPQINLRSGHADSVEALLRWRHPQLGPVSPAEFIGVAEATDLIKPLTYWTLREALTQAAKWQAQQFSTRIAVNLSARLLQDHDFPGQLKALLHAHRAEPRLLELEITESAMMADTDRALKVIRELRELGVMMSVDDFGTGFSSLGYLRDLPVHALKLTSRSSCTCWTAIVIGSSSTPRCRWRMRCACKS